MHDRQEPCETQLRPVSAPCAALRQLAFQDPQRFPVLLESAAVGPLGRFTVLGAFPREVLWQDGAGRLQGSGAEAGGSTGFLAALETAWRRERQAQPPAGSVLAELPFRGGWLVFLGYELADEIEPRLALHALTRPGAHAPGALALRVGAGLIYDHTRAQMWAFAEAPQAQLLDELTAIATALSDTGNIWPKPQLEVVEEDPKHFHRRVEAALEYIRAGDIYQANLSRPWRAALPENVDLQPLAAGLYEQLRTTNPAPFAAWVQFRDWWLLSSSPERLVRARGDRVETRPIAGTRPRSGVDERMAREISALIQHPKERAEHIMLIDLERNDLGRVCRAGSVRVDQFMVVESYAHVHHIVSNIHGERLPDLTPVDVLRAVFPGGTITGCPKFRCMQLIAELELEARQAYTGALGFINRDGSMDFNILIRSLTLGGGQMEFRTGAGIVAESDWRQELNETRAKARGLLTGMTTRRT
jgi:anthranilate synthase component 1